MAHVDATVFVCKPAHEVFEFLADGRNQKLWRPSVTDINLKFGKPGAVGTVYKQGLKGPKGKRVDADYQITHVRHNEEIDFEVVSGPAKGRGKYCLAELSDGTRVKFILDCHPKGFGKIIELMEGNVARLLKQEIDELQNLKTYMEKAEHSEPSKV